MNPNTQILFLPVNSYGTKVDVCVSTSILCVGMCLILGYEIIPTLIKK